MPEHFTSPLAKRRRESTLEQFYLPLRLTASLVVSALLHKMVLEASTLATSAHTAADTIADDVRDVYDRLSSVARQPNAEQLQVKTALRTELQAQLEGGTVRDIDLSRFYFVSETVSANISENNIRLSEAHYQDIIERAQALSANGASQAEVLGFILKQQGRYQPGKPLLNNLLGRGVGNCEARMKYITAAVEDLYPDIANSGQLGVQLFGEYTDAEGKTHPPHVRAVIDQGDSLLILEGDAVRTEIKTVDTAPVVEAQWLAAASYLVGQGDFSYEDFGLDSVKSGLDATRQSASFLVMPHSPAHYFGGNGLSTGDIDPNPVAGSWGGTRRYQAAGVTILSEPITDAMVAQHTAERKAVVDSAWQADRDFEETLQDKSLRVFPSFDRGYYIIDLTRAADARPITQADISRVTQFVTEDNVSDTGRRSQEYHPINVRLRGDQILPAASESLIYDVEIEGTPSLLTLLSAQHTDVTINDPLSLSAFNALPNAVFSSLEIHLQQAGGDILDETLKDKARQLFVYRELSYPGDIKPGVKAVKLWNVPAFVRTDQCRVDGSILHNANLEQVVLSGCLPAADVNLQAATDLRFNYFVDNDTAIPRLHVAQPVETIIYEIPFGHLPSQAFSVSSLNKDTRIFLQVQTIPSEAIANATVGYLGLFDQNNYQGKIRTDSNEWENIDFITKKRFIAARAFAGSTIMELDLDLIWTDWEIDAGAFEGSTIGEVTVTAAEQDRQRVEQIQFPPGTKVTYDFYLK